MDKIKYITIAAIIMMVSLTTAALAMDKPLEASFITPGEGRSEAEAELNAEATYSRQAASSVAPVEPAALPGDVIYFSDFEADNGGMIPSLDWVWDVYAWNGATCDSSNYPPANAYSGTHMWGTRLNTCYQNLGNNSGYSTCSNTNPADDSILTLTVDLTGYSEATLSWWEWYDLFSTWDWAQVFANGVPVYNHCETSFVQPTTWVQATADLSPYAGGLVTLEFHMMASTVVNHAGWYVDDVMVVAGAPPEPDIVVDPLSLEMTLVTGETNTLPFTITNEGTGDLAWALAGGANWMSQDPTSGTVLSGESTAVTVTYDATGLPPAVYTTTLEVESNDPDEPLVPIACTMAVLGEPDIVVEPTSLEMTLPPGYTDILTFTISNIGTTNLTWELSDGAPWMSQNPTSGSVLAGGSTDVVVMFDSTGLTPEIYTASIEVISDDPDEPSIVLPVTLTVSNYNVFLPIIIK